MPAFLNKSDLRDRIVLQLRTELALQTRAAQVSHEEAISEESRPENKYDMHSQEAAYLAEGQARLAAEIAGNLALYETMALPSVDTTSVVALGVGVAVEQNGKRTWYFIGPRAGGMEVELDGTTILVLTPQSPLGRELLGKKIGDVVKIPSRGSTAVHRIVELA